MQTVRRNELQALLERISHASILSIVATTIPTLRKTLTTGEVCPFWTAYKQGQLKKTASVNGVVYWIYTNSVNNQRKREGLPADFVAMPRKWGHRLPNSPFVQHTTKEGETKLYLELKVEHSLGYSYTLQGKPIDGEVVNRWLQPKGESRQGVEKEVIPRDYDLANINEVRAFGEVYQVVD